MKRLGDVPELDFSAAIGASDRAPGAISLAER